MTGEFLRTSTRHITSIAALMASSIALLVLIIAAIYKIYISEKLDLFTKDLVDNGNFNLALRVSAGVVAGALVGVLLCCTYYLVCMVIKGTYAAPKSESRVADLDDSNPSVVYVERSPRAPPEERRRSPLRRAGASSTPDGWRSYHVFDFDIQNTSNCEILIQKISMEVDHIKIDPTPELECCVSVSKSKKDYPSRPFNFDGDLLNFSIRNHGWDRAKHCEIEIDNAILNKIFDPSVRKHEFSVEPGEKADFEIRHNAIIESEYNILMKQEILRQKKDFEENFENLVSDELRSVRRVYRSMPIRSDQERLKKFLSTPENRKRYMSNPSIGNEVGVRTWEDVHYNEDHEKEKAGIRLREEQENKLNDAGLKIDPMLIKYKMVDSAGCQSEGTIWVETDGPWGGTILARPTIFRFHENEPIFITPLMFDKVRAFVIDADRSAQIRDHDVSRSVNAGETERFEIIVSATKSIYVKFRLKFYLREGACIESRPFEFEIWAPRNLPSEDRCEDLSTPAR